MGKVLTAILAMTVSLLPIISAVLFFSGDMYHGVRISFWDHNPNMFPLSVAEKISLGAEVVAANTYKYIFYFFIVFAIAFLILWFLLGLFSKIRCRLPNNFRVFKKREVKELSEIERTVFMIGISVYLLGAFSILFAMLVFNGYKASQSLAFQNQSKRLTQYECSLKSKKACQKEGVDTLRVSTFHTEDKQFKGFAIECSESNCLIFTDKKEIVSISLSDIKIRITVPPQINENGGKQ